MNMIEVYAQKIADFFDKAITYIMDHIVKFFQ